MVTQKEVQSCEHESKSFLGKTDEEGNTEARQLSHVVIEDEKRKTQSLQEMKEYFCNPVRKEKEQLLNAVVEDSVNIGQLWKVEAKEEQLLSAAMGDHN